MFGSFMSDTVSAGGRLGWEKLVRKKAKCHHKLTVDWIGGAWMGFSAEGFPLLVRIVYIVGGGSCLTLRHVSAGGSSRSSGRKEVGRFPSVYLGTVSLFVMAENFLLDEIDSLPSATSWCSDLLSTGGDILTMTDKTMSFEGEPEEVQLPSEFLEIDLLMKDVPAPFMLEMVNEDAQETDDSVIPDLSASPVSDMEGNYLLDELMSLNVPEKAPKKKTAKKPKTPTVTKTITKEIEESVLRVKPAQFCHVCWRSTKRVEVAICSNIARSACRKVICQKCFHKFGWNFENASAPSSNWTCTHCCGNCPNKAQCYVYGRTNERRRKQRAALKASTL